MNKQYYDWLNHRMFFFPEDGEFVLQVSNVEYDSEGNEVLDFVETSTGKGFSLYKDEFEEYLENGRVVEVFTQKLIPTFKGLLRRLFRKDSSKTKANQ